MVCCVVMWGDVFIGVVIFGVNGEVFFEVGNEWECIGDLMVYVEVLVICCVVEVCDGWCFGDCIFVVILELCIMCVGIIVVVRILRVVFGVFDLKVGVVSFFFDVMCDLRLLYWLKVVIGVMVEELFVLLCEFFDGYWVCIVDG